ncbi:uncharacterized protein LOC112575348 [Pomacea canaliculata]|uniref:uncharacterized protein LOC112575348 n=1 Tax=Pomacea canaliculata TaxID=400727 RepID=UPI000D738532|nr:uncharacterized protein LOC112575348 [Pomacea canaliculata]
MTGLTALSVVCFLLLLVHTTSVEGSCYIDNSIVDEKTHRIHCIATDGTRIEENESLVTSDCFKCTCRGLRLNCCGVGIAAGHVMPPEGFKIQRVPPCGYTFVPVSH